MVTASARKGEVEALTEDGRGQDLYPPTGMVTASARKGEVEALTEDGRGRWSKTCTLLQGW